MKILEERERTLKPPALNCNEKDEEEGEESDFAIIESNWWTLMNIQNKKQ